MRPAGLLVALALSACSSPGPAKPGPLRAGVATVPLGAPVGTPTGGYGRQRVPTDPTSPWADGHHPTVGVQTQPTARALALSNGVTTVVLVRLDACLTVATLRWRAQELLEARGHAVPLLVWATHTHAAPARYFHPAPVGGAGGFDPTRNAMDSFDPEVESRLASSIATAAAEALEAMKPASVGVAAIDAGELSRDRRCANDDLYGAGYRDTTMTVVRLDEVDATGTPVRPLTGLVSFATHGTLLDDDNHLFTVDAPGAIELYGSDAVGVPLVYLQGAAGDVSPDSGGLQAEFQGMERLGRVAARKVSDAWARAAPPSAPAQATLRHFELPIEPSRAAIGYREGEFPENGGVGCGLGDRHCPPVEATPQSIVCLPLARRPFRQTSVVALQLESVLLGSLPGEPMTAIGARVAAAGAKVAGVSTVLTVGYAQDHFGYLLEERDYLRLGYEPYVSPLGWKFGDFIVARLTQAFDGLGQEAPPLSRPVTALFTPRVATESAAVLAQVGSTGDLRRPETATFVFEGGDPMLGTPRVALEREEGGSFAPVRASPVRLVVGGPEIVLFYEPSVAGAHRWRAQWETLPDTPLGRYRLVATGHARQGGVESTYEVRSNPFTLDVADALGARVSASLSAAGELAVTFRLPPNPSERDPSGTVIKHFRLRDEGARSGDGARARGGAASGTLRLPDGSSRAVALTFDEAQTAYVVGGVPLQAGRYELTLPAGAVRDGAGNTNGAALSVAVSR